MAQDPITYNKLDNINSTIDNINTVTKQTQTAVGGVNTNTNSKIKQVKDKTDQIPDIKSKTELIDDIKALLENSTNGLKSIKDGINSIEIPDSVNLTPITTKLSTIETETNKIDGIKNQTNNINTINSTVNSIKSSLTTLNNTLDNGFLVVDVSTGEYARQLNYTATLTPIPWATPIEKQGTTGKPLIFQNLTNRQYTISFSEEANYEKPQSQDIQIEEKTITTLSTKYAQRTGKLEVEVVTDIPVREIEYTVTITNDNDNSLQFKRKAIGEGKLFFENIPAGIYTVSVNNISNYSTPVETSVSINEKSDPRITLKYTLNNVNLSTCSWEGIDKIVKAGRAQHFFSIGDTKEIYLSNNDSITVEILDFDHDTVQGGQTHTITFSTKNLTTYPTWYSSRGNNGLGFYYTMMVSYLNCNFYSMFPKELKSVIKPTYKKIRDQLDDDPNEFGQGGRLNLFLFSEYEVYGRVIKSMGKEGTHYSAFTNSKRKKRLNNGKGDYSSWWLSSFTPDEFNDFLYVPASGGDSETMSGREKLGICFGFCI